nr:aldo/keto reductase [Actinophytocola oryzae]
MLEAVQRVAAVAADLGTTLPRLALAWVLNNPAVSSAIIGLSRPEQLADNLPVPEVDLTPDVPGRHRHGPHRPGARRPGGTLTGEDGQALRRHGGLAPMTAAGDAVPPGFTTRTYPSRRDRLPRWRRPRGGAS